MEQKDEPQPMQKRQSGITATIKQSLGLGPRASSRVHPEEPGIMSRMSMAIGFGPSRTSKRNVGKEEPGIMSRMSMAMGFGSTKGNKHMEKPPPRPDKRRSRSLLEPGSPRGAVAEPGKRGAAVLSTGAACTPPGVFSAAEQSLSTVRTEESAARYTIEPQSTRVSHRCIVCVRRYRCWWRSTSRRAR